MSLFVPVTLALTPLAAAASGGVPKLVTIAVVVVCGAFSVWVFGHNHRQ
ncbi:hypothetical protein EDF39_1112 [Frondihabitans sp. PhB161]|nr:hypothetical protein EDF37_1110 [Frondihabitans sp. PhB153]RPF08715.1 hypothetical protein EDF39_1112 [Frondihabitans sp. PhB161]